MFSKEGGFKTPRLGLFGRITVIYFAQNLPHELTVTLSQKNKGKQPEKPAPKKVPRKEKLGPRVKITLPPGISIGFDPFALPDDLLPIDDSFGQNPQPMQADGIHIEMPRRKRSLEEVPIDIPTTGEITDQEFYHGLLPREDVIRMLVNRGEFLLRTTEISDTTNKQFCLSVKPELEPVQHFMIMEKENRFFLTDELGFASILEMVHHCIVNKVLFGNPTVQLGHPILRQGWEFKPEQIKCGTEIGMGEFGPVFLGKVTLAGNGAQVEVAIKTMKLSCLNKEKIKDMMRAVRVMRKLDHVNCVRCFGVSAFADPLMVVLEMVKNGALDRYLIVRNMSIPIEDRIQMCLDAAAGLSHIHSKGVVHRDIASRNCLYGDKILKISNFGLACEATSYIMKPGDKTAIRATAPEVFETQTFTPAADIWAFGFIIYEVFNNGQQPYAHLNCAQMKQEIINNKVNLNLPSWTPSFIKELMNEVFKIDPEGRIKAPAIRTFIEQARPEIGGGRKKQLKDKSESPPMKSMDQDERSPKKGKKCKIRTRRRHNKN